MSVINKTEYKKSNIEKFSAPLMFVIIVFSVIFIMSVSFRVANIQVVGNEHYTDAEIINAIDIEEGDNLFFFDRFAAVSRVFAKLPYIEEVSIERNLPNKVIVEVQESRAVAYIKLGTELWSFDHNCKLLGKATELEENELIKISGFEPGTFYIGEVITQIEDHNDYVEFLVNILHQIQDRNITEYVSEIDLSDINNVFLIYNGQYKIIIGNSDNYENKFGLFLSAISQLKSGDVGIINVSDYPSCKFSPY